MKNILLVSGVVLLIILVFVVTIFTQKKEEERIEKVVQDRGGEVIQINSKAIALGPFHYRNKGQNVYSFTYKIDGEVETGWMRSSVFSDDYVFKEGEEKEKIKY